MKFVHSDREFAELLRIVGAEMSPAIAPSMVEKDYWITHTLWSIQRTGLSCSFKGGTSLSKAFGLIHRFSEDIDVKLGRGRAEGVAAVTNWKSEGKASIAARREFFESVRRVLKVPGAKLELIEFEPSWRSAELRVIYPSVVGEPLPQPMKPFVVIEAGSARVLPSVARDLTSFVHDGLARRGMNSDFEDNRPRALDCVHPLVTLIEKLDAIGRKFDRSDVDAAKFVRHYEDAARIIENLPSIAPPEQTAKELVREMCAQNEIKALMAFGAPAIAFDKSARWNELRAAYADTNVLYFGPQLGLGRACNMIRNWLETM